jgi:hypothetical protein
VLQRDLHRCVTGERRVPGQAVVRDGAERVDVHRSRDRLAGSLLGCHVQGGAGHRVAGGDRGDVGRPRDAEVDEDDRTVRSDQQVARLDVAVHDAAGVGGLQRVGCLRENG